LETVSMKENKPRRPVVKLVPYQDIEPRAIQSDKASKVTGRIAIGKADGATNFCMRVFEIGAGGFTPRHSHDWEHEIFFHAGEGEVFHKGQWNKVSPGFVAFIPGGEEHQIRTTGTAALAFVCLIPNGPPEL
jgi:quercetin dioxygenase-like cupin family protein